MNDTSDTMTPTNGHHRLDDYSTGLDRAPPANYLSDNTSAPAKPRISRRKGDAPPLPNPLPELLSAAQVAQLMSISIRTVWRLLDRDQLPQPARYNRKLVRWHTYDVLAYLEAQRKAVPV